MHYDIHLMEPLLKTFLCRDDLRITMSMVLQMVRELLPVLCHSSQCKAHPGFINCLKVKKLFQHAKSCPVQIARGCQACRRHGR